MPGSGVGASTRASVGGVEAYTPPTRMYLRPARLHC